MASGSSVNRLGSSTYYWDTGYISKLYLSSSCYLSASGSNLQVNGTTIGGGADPNMAGKEVRMGGSTTYYITATTGRQLRPSSSSSYYAFYLGTSSYYWHYAYIGSNTVKLGNSTSSKLGFFFRYACDKANGVLICYGGDSDFRAEEIRLDRIRRNIS